MTDLDEVLRSSMRSARRPVDARPSLSDVRRRARRRNRRRTATMAGVLGVAGVATTALVIERSGPASNTFLGEGGTDVPTTMLEMSTVSVPGVESTVISRALVWQALANAKLDAAGLRIDPETAGPAELDAMPSADAQFGCTTDPCRALFTYVVWHELAKLLGFNGDVSLMHEVNPEIDFSASPVEGQFVHTGAYVAVPVTATTVLIGSDTAPPTTVPEGTSPADETTTTNAYFDGVMLIDAGAPAGAMDDVFARLSGYNRTIFPSSGKTSERTMIMPVSGDTAMATAVGVAIGIDGFDTWDPSFVGENVSGLVAVIVGADYWDRAAVTTTTNTP